MELSTRGKADTESGCVLPKSPARRNSESRFTSTCLGRDFCAIGDLPVQVVSWKSVLRELQTKYTSTNSQSGSQKSKFNLFLGQLPRQISSSNLYQTRVIR